MNEKKETWALFVSCGSMDADMTAVELKDALGLGVFDVMEVANRIPGVLFSGTEKDMKTAADGLQAHGIECSVRPVDATMAAMTEELTFPDGSNDLKAAYKLMKQRKGG